MFKPVSVNGPYKNPGDDHPYITVDVRTSEPKPGWDGVHFAAIKVWGDDSILAVLELCGIFEIEGRDQVLHRWGSNKYEAE